MKRTKLTKTLFARVQPETFKKIEKTRKQMGLSRSFFLDSILSGGFKEGDYDYLETGQDSSKKDKTCSK